VGQTDENRPGDRTRFLEKNAEPVTDRDQTPAATCSCRKVIRPESRRAPGFVFGRVERGGDFSPGPHRGWGRLVNGLPRVGARTGSTRRDAPQAFVRGSCEPGARAAAPPGPLGPGPDQGPSLVLTRCCQLAGDPGGDRLSGGGGDTVVGTSGAPPVGTAALPSLAACCSLTGGRRRNRVGRPWWRELHPRPRRPSRPRRPNCTTRWNRRPRGLHRRRGNGAGPRQSGVLGPGYPGLERHIGKLILRRCGDGNGTTGGPGPDFLTEDRGWSRDFFLRPVPRRTSRQPCRAGPPHGRAGDPTQATDAARRGVWQPTSFGDPRRFATLTPSAHRSNRGAVVTRRGAWGGPGGGAG